MEYESMDDVPEDEIELSETDIARPKGENLDLPDNSDSEGDDNELEKDSHGGDDTDSELEDYYKELGIDEEKDFSKKATKKTEEQAIYKKEKKEGKGKKGEQVVEKPGESNKDRVLDKIIKSTREDPNYSNLTKIIKLVKQIFNITEEKTEKEEDDKSDDDEDDQKSKKQ